MAQQLVVTSRMPSGGTWVFRALRSPLAKLRGLLGTGPDARPVALLGCDSIHTYGMGYPLDVAFVGRDGEVLDEWRSVAPGQTRSRRGAWVTLERPHCRGTWVVRGEYVNMDLREG